MKKLARPPNQYHYLLFLILLFFSATYAQSPVNQATASDYPHRESSHLRANQSPVADLTVSPTTGKLPLLITADASGSSDPDGNIVKFEWFIDGEPLGVAEDVGTIKFTFQGEGTYLIAVTVTDNQGLTATKQQKVKVTTTDVVNQSPVASFTVTPTQGEAPLTVNVDAGSSSDDEEIANYQWKISDGQTATGVKASFTFKTAGDYTLVLTVTDDQGLTATKQQTVQVTAKPVANQPPEASFTVAPTQGEAPLTVNVDASESSDEGKIASYQWQVSDGQTATGVKASFNFDTAGNYTITLTVKDDKGATATQTETVEVIAKTVQPPSTNLPSLGENFAGGIAVNDQPPQQRAVLKLADTVDVTGTMTVNSSDVGKTADIFVYAEATLPPLEDEFYFMLGEGLTISLWDRNPANLVAFQRDVTLGAVQTVSMYQGNFIYPGNLKIFFGYRLPEGTLVTNSDPITITISQQGEPQFRGLVQVTPTDTDKVTLAWLPATDDDTPPEAITYQVHLSDQPNFTPSTATLQTAVTGQEKTEVLGLATGQTYNVLVVAVDQDGNESLERDYRTVTTLSEPVGEIPNSTPIITRITDPQTNLGFIIADSEELIVFAGEKNAQGDLTSITSITYHTAEDVSNEVSSEPTQQTTSQTIHFNLGDDIIKPKLVVELPDGNKIEARNYDPNTGIADLSVIKNGEMVGQYPKVQIAPEGDSLDQLVDLIAGIERGAKDLLGKVIGTYCEFFPDIIEASFWVVERAEGKGFCNSDLVKNAMKDGIVKCRTKPIKDFLSVGDLFSSPVIETGELLPKCKGTLEVNPLNPEFYLNTLDCLGGLVTLYKTAEQVNKECKEENPTETLPTTGHGIPDNTSTMQHGIPDNTSTMQHGIPDNTQTMAFGIKDRCYSGPTGEHGNYVTIKENGVERKVKDGEWINGYDNGSFSVTTYSEGIQNGYSGFWDASCKPRTWHGNYVNGKKDGMWFDVISWGDGYFDSFTYVNGVKQGPAGQWNADGTARGCHGNYVDDKQDGMWYCYDNNGKPSTWSGKYVNGKKDGVWFDVISWGDGYFDSFTYVNGIKQGPAGQWNADGTARGCHGNYTNDKQVGVWTCYKDDGTTYTETYVEGMKQ